MSPSRKKALLWRVLSPLAWPLVLLYAMAVRLKNAAYDLRISKQRRLFWPVISVGNLSVGGTGKTPVVMLLTGLLEARGWTVDVLSRGYGRNGQHTVRVDAQGNAEMFGDEPLQMARRGLAVYVGPDRYRTGLLAEQDTQVNSNRISRLHILDDGFQHRRLNRAVDIVLLRRADLADDMLPLGRLREPLCALERADICVLRAEDIDLKDRVLRLMNQTDPARVWIVERQMISPALLSDSSHRARNALAFCAIGDPDGFFDGLRRSGIQVNEEISFRDHHVYTYNDVERLKAAAKRSGAQFFVTTEKDGVRFASDLRIELGLPLTIVGLELFLCDEPGSLAMLESMLTRPNTKSLHPEQRNVR